MRRTFTLAKSWAEAYRKSDPSHAWDLQMLVTLTSILPIFLIIALGLALRKGGIPSTEFWNVNDKLVYWVLMPCLMFNKVSLAELNNPNLIPYAITLITGFFVAVAFGVTIAWMNGFKAAQGTSILQGCARNNAFVALALSASLYGPSGFEYAILASAILIPVTNVVMVVLLVMALQPGKRSNLPLAILRDLIRNPHIISITLALAVNQLIGTEIPVLHELTRILGLSALPITLLAVGANLRVKDMAASASALFFSFVGKMMIFPATVLALGLMFSLPPTLLIIAVIYAMSPTAASSYTLARQLGGDAPMMAAIVTLQTLAAVATIPLTLYLLEWVV
ncbi:AEC family transporter [Phaeobacter gallaeciensis]|nr:AEC family transporter [Phaeobacter gallaeciensis]